jgi:cyanophycinase-like exopeptidase
MASPRSGVICLQGGNELTPDCRPMDHRLLELAGRGQVVVVPLASEPGADYARTSENAVRYFRDLGADVVAAPDARRDPTAAADAVAGAQLVFLTGGSPRRLRDALVASGLGERIRERWHDGAAVVGSSAGAMVACDVTLLPKWRGNPDAGPGLGLISGYVVVPHYDGKRGSWVKVALSVAPAVLGVPECSGVVLNGGDLTALGVAASTVITADGRKELALA